MNFKKYKEEQNNEASRFFDRDWYEWQNPDWSNTYSDSYEHYMQLGKFEDRDPSPLVDIKRYRSTIGNLNLSDDLFCQINKGIRGRAFGVYENYDDLTLSQAEFYKKIFLYNHKYRSVRSNARNLVIVQAGPGSLHNSWYDESICEFDLLINLYDPTNLSTDKGDYIYSQIGTKFTAVSKLYFENQALFDSYDFIFLLDDDIYIGTPEINKLFEICDRKNVAGAQPSLSANSHCIWDTFFNQGDTARKVNGIEIMMPVLSRDLMKLCAHHFQESVSGFGLDMLWSKIVKDKMPGRYMYVIDEVKAVHDKPIDDAGGAYYENMRRNLINPKSELWNLVTKHYLDLEFQQITPDVSTAKSKRI